MPISIAMVALDENAELSGEDIRRDLQRTWPSLPRATDLEEKDDSIAFRLGQTDVIMMKMPAPIPWTDLKGPCETSWLWPDATKVLKRHKEHLIVTVSSEEGPIEQSRWLTYVIASIVETCKQAVGVYWGNATMVISPKVFRDFAAEILPHANPLFVWVDFRVSPGEGESSVGFTTGMQALGHMEFETLNSPESAGELRERLHGLAAYILENGPVIKDGDTVGEDANERITVRYAKSAFGHKGKVMRLDYSSAAKKPWWKVW